MIKATKKELYNALYLVCFEKMNADIPDGKCNGCIANYVEQCPKCWIEYYLKVARETDDDC